MVWPSTGKHMGVSKASLAVVVHASGMCEAGVMIEKFCKDAGLTMFMLCDLNLAEPTPEKARKKISGVAAQTPE